METREIQKEEIDSPYKLNLTYKDLDNEVALANKLKKLAEIIVRKHFYASLNEKDDLVSIGIVKAYSMIKEGNFSPEKGNLCTFLYTGMRNDMHNYLYHIGKFNTSDIDDIKEVYKDEKNCYESVEDCDDIQVGYSLIHTVCMRLSPYLGDSIESQVVSSIRNFGFGVEGMLPVRKRHTLSCCTDLLKERYGDEARDDIIGRIIGIILWEKREHDKRFA